LDERRPIEEMIGEGFREVGVLVFVFAILDKLIAGSITGGWTATAIAISLGFFWAGCFIEKRRRPIE
jgi:hypothetical protein